MISQLEQYNIYGLLYFAAYNDKDENDYHESCYFLSCHSEGVQRLQQSIMLPRFARNKRENGTRSSIKHYK